MGTYTLGTHEFDTSKPLVERRFLCFCFFFAVGKRNEVPPRTVANSAKETIQERTREDSKSSNPGPNPDRKPETQAPALNTPQYSPPARRAKFPCTSSSYRRRSASWF